jgi:probable rRNA maturation factor
VSIEIANESGVGVDEASLASLARHVLDGMRVHPLAELSVLLVDEPAMTELHLRWMGEPGPTDVLAFPMDEIRPPQPGGAHADHSAAEPPEIPGLLGDVVICPQVAKAQARQAGHSVKDEISLLCTHGILHLLGYDHAEPDEHATMFALQDKLLSSWRADQAAGASKSDGADLGGPGADQASIDSATASADTDEAASDSASASDSAPAPDSASGSGSATDSVGRDGREGPR